MEAKDQVISLNQLIPIAPKPTFTVNQPKQLQSPMSKPELEPVAVTQKENREKNTITLHTLLQKPGSEVGTPSKENEQKALLRQCFSTIVDRKVLCVSMSDLRYILANELNINFDTLRPGLENVLAEALTYYMKLWPGWTRSTQYFSGQLQFKKWFEKFRQYLIYKVNYIIKVCTAMPESFDDGMTNTKKSVICENSVEVQTDPIVSSNKSEAPYCLSIAGTPSILNNLVFVKQENSNDILIKQHSERPWVNLTTVQFLNWPNVDVEVKLPDISISRNNIPDYKRYIGLSGDIKQISTSEIETFVKPSNYVYENVVYSYSFISTYIEQLMELIKRCPEVNAERVELLENIFKLYLEDIEEANVSNKTVCTYTLVNYHIGKFFYFRNKRIMGKGSNSNEVVNFYELFAPKVEYGTGYIKAIQDITTPETSFISINKIKHALENKTKELEDFIFIVNNTCIVFKCNMCFKNFTGPYAKHNLVQHFRKDHKLDQTVLCFKCRRQHDILNLTANRWKHNCVESV